MMWDPEKLIELAHAMDDHRERYLKWRAICDRYERGKETKLGLIRMGLVKDKKTQDDLKAETRSHGDYQKYLEEWASAEQNMISARVEYENLQCQFEAYQSALSYQREHMKRLGG